MLPHQMGTRPVSLFCVAAPTDTALLVQWETHLLPLQQAGLLTFWSERQIAAGTDRMAELVRFLDQADSVILLLSADFFADNTCLTLMREGLQRKSANHTRLIPLLVRPVVWQESEELREFTALPANGVAITTWESPDEGWRQAVLGLQRMLGLPARKTSSVSKSATTDRERMLRLLRRTYQTSLDDSLQGIAWMELGLAEHPDAIRNATHLLQRLPDRTERALPTGTSILSVYDQAEEELLILGAPGAGKSTLLLNLALRLIERAEDDATRPLPMIVPLSSWAIPRPSLPSGAPPYPALADWLVEQLERIYDIPRKLGEQWVEQGQILPMLDGLDEMKRDARPPCIEAINVYRKTHVGPLVVCSRSAEYQTASLHERLLLQNAVMVQPLTGEQIELLIQQGGEALEAFREALRDSKELRELVKTPLILNIVILTYYDLPLADLPQQREAFEYQIWVDYVERMVREKGAERQGRQDVPVKRYSLDQTCSWLGWLARQMHAHNQTVFMVGMLEPDWLPKEQLLLYRCCFGALIGLPYGLLVGSLAWWIGGLLVGLLAGSLIGLLVGLLAGWVGGVPAGQVIERIGLLTYVILPYALVLLPFGLLAWQLYQSFYGVLIGMFGWLFGELIFGVVLWLLGSLALSSVEDGQHEGVQQLFLRFWLALDGAFPFRADSFLEDARARHLLLRVRGGYRFIHRLLLDHLADLEGVAAPSPNPLETTASVPTSAGEHET